MHRCAKGYSPIAAELLQLTPSTRRTGKRPFGADETTFRRPSRIFKPQRIDTMKNTFTASIVLALALASLAGGQAMAATDSFGVELSPNYASANGTTREQVRAELVQANRATVVVTDEFGVAMPAAYAAAPASGLTRAQVRAELIKANCATQAHTDEFGVSFDFVG
jgi:hypothetical protein